MVKIAVIGCGLMGIKIAGEMAYHGHRVRMYDSSLEALNAAYDRMEEDKQMLREEGLMAHKNFIGQVLCLSQLEETVRDAEFIFEAVVDNLKIKKDLFERISHLCSPKAVLATNTLHLDLTEVFQQTAYKERTLGLRFLYPIYYIPEVEFTTSKDTSTEVIDRVRTLLEHMGKTLFLRSGGEPLILTEDQREERKKARLEQIKNSSGLGHYFENRIPTLSHRGNNMPSQEDEQEKHRRAHQRLHPVSYSDSECAICMDRPRDSLLCPCHHMITCMECAKSLHNRHDGCPICRKEITEIIRIYHS